MKSGETEDRLVGGWRLGALIGQGSHGAVYHATRPDQALPVALKLVRLDGDAAAAGRAFKTATATAASLQHPGIVAVLDAGIEGGMGWLAMELVQGGDLTAFTHASKLLPPARVVQIALAVAEALDHAHRRGVVHRDLKPANVLMRAADGAVKLADLGLVRADDAAQTATGIVPGSPAYMAPEQLAGRVPNAQTDLYALGVLMFELLAGRLPHDAASMGELLRLVAFVPAPALQTLRPGLPEPLCALVAGLLAKLPADRPDDAAAVTARLAGLAGTA